MPHGVQHGGPRVGQEWDRILEAKHPAVEAADRDDQRRFRGALESRTRVTRATPSRQRPQMSKTSMDAKSAPGPSFGCRFMLAE